MCDAAVTKLRFDRVQFISRASVPFSLPHFTIVHGELWNEIRGWALHSWECWAESCFCCLISTFITSDTSMTWYLRSISWQQYHDLIEPASGSTWNVRSRPCQTADLLSRQTWPAESWDASLLYQTSCHLQPPSDAPPTDSDQTTVSPWSPGHLRRFFLGSRATAHGDLC